MTSGAVVTDEAKVKRQLWCYLQTNASPVLSKHSTIVLDSSLECNACIFARGCFKHRCLKREKPGIQLKRLWSKPSSCTATTRVLIPRIHPTGQRRGRCKLRRKLFSVRAADNDPSDLRSHLPQKVFLSVKPATNRGSITPPQHPPCTALKHWLLEVSDFDECLGKYTASQESDTAA